MATIDTILSNIAASCPELSSTSNAALYKKMAQAIAVTIDGTLSEFNNNQTALTNILAQKNYGSAQSYINQALAFQYGDSLEIDPDTLAYYYPVVDTTKQIISQAAFSAINSGGLITLTLKVAKKDTITGKLVKLDTSEKNSFDNYYLTFELPGLPVTKLSLDANIFDFNMRVTYISSYDFNSIQSAVTSALYSFRNSFALNGLLYINDVSSYIKSNVAGVRDVFLSNTTIDTIGFVDVTALSAGYFDYLDDILTRVTYNAVQA